MVGLLQGHILGQQKSIIKLALWPGIVCNVGRIGATRRPLDRDDELGGDRDEDKHSLLAHKTFTYIRCDGMG